MVHVANGTDDPTLKDVALVTYEQVGNTIERILIDYDKNSRVSP